MIRGRDLTWTWYDDASTPAATEIDPACIASFEFRYGATFSERDHPRMFLSYGVLVLNEALDISAAENWHELKATKGDYTYLHLRIADFVVAPEKFQTRFEVAGLGTADADRPVTWSITPSKSDLSFAITDLTLPDILIYEAVGAPIAGFELTAGANAGEGEFDSTRRRILTNIETFNSCVLLEDVQSGDKEWLAYPLPITEASDTRTVDGQYATPNVNLLIDKFQLRKARAWKADEYLVLQEDAPYQSKRITVHAQGSKNDDGFYEANINYFYDGQQQYGIRGVELVYNGVAQEAWWYVQYDGPYQSVDGTSKRQARIRWQNNTDDSNYDNINTARVSLWVKDDYTPEWESVLADDLTESESRRIGGSEIVLYDDTLDVVQSVIDEWQDWEPYYAKMQFLIDTLDDGSVIKQAVGNRIEITAGDLINHYAIIMGVQWKIKGDEPIIIGWDAILQSERPVEGAAGASPLSHDSDELSMNDEVLFLG